MLRKHPKIILKDKVSNSPMLSPRSYLRHNKPKEDGSPNPKMMTPKKNFETNCMQNGMNPWYHENDRLVEEFLAVHQR